MNFYKIAIIGLGYVGLPLAIEFAKKYKVVGYDINYKRIDDLKKGIDDTREADIEELLQVTDSENPDRLSFTSDLSDISLCNIFIIAVPTPVNQFKRPDLQHLLNATRSIAGILKKNDIVIYESTVYPGCTEEECVPILEKYSGLQFNIDFFCGYSPERINPGDKLNTLTKIKKVTSGSTKDTARVVNALYASIITAGTHLAPSLKIAEASKAIENAQRDVNISFVNELAFIFDRMGIDTMDVIEAAATKWNFLKYKPGLVGGHCIGVDPYYLAYKAKSLGYHPQVLLSGRRVNDDMGMFVANKVLKLMIKKGIAIKGCKCLILGFTFKENCPDIRNTKVIDVYNELVQFNVLVDIFDPWADPDLVAKEYNITVQNKLANQKYDAIILAVAHDVFKTLKIEEIKQSNSVVFDTKSFLDRSVVDGRL